jgi:hypothetical protein
MKTRTLIFVIVLLFALFVSFAGDKISIEDIYGTWVNSDYNENAYMGKAIEHPDGTYELFNKVTDTEPAWTRKEIITDSWYDKEGNLWISYTFEEIYLYTVVDLPDFSGYGLYKFSDSGKVRENVWAQADYPDEMSPIGGNYSIHYRQE